MRQIENTLQFLAWAVWFALCVVASATASMFLTITALVMFAALEALAIIDGDGSGDTLSGVVWSFYRGKPARFHLVAGFAVFLVGMFMYPLTGEVLFVWAARWGLGVGLWLWLWDHFKHMGRNG